MCEAHGVYRGVRKRLRGETAHLIKVRGGYKAQFDSFRHREAYGRWFFPTKDFEEICNEQVER